MFPILHLKLYCYNKFLMELDHLNDMSIGHFISLIINSGCYTYLCFFPCIMVETFNYGLIGSYQIVQELY